MIETFTQNDVLRYLYGETSDSEKQQIKNTLRWDTDLAEFYFETRQLKSDLNDCMLEPSQSSIDAIMQHAKHTELQNI